MLAAITSIQIYPETVSLGSIISFITNVVTKKIMFTMVLSYNSDINHFFKLVDNVIYRFKWCLWLINGHKYLRKNKFRIFFQQAKMVKLHKLIYSSLFM